MAEVTARKRNNKWEYRFEAAKIDGKRKQVSKGGFLTKQAALKAGVQALAEYNNSGSVFEPSSISVHDYLNYWFDTYCITNLKYNSQVNYKNIIENHLQPNLGKYKLSSLSAAVIQEYANSLKMNGFAKGSLKSIMSVLSAALFYAVEPLHYISSSPMEHVKLPKVEKKPKERIILTTEEWKSITNRFQPPSRFYIPLMIGYYTGLRISETFALTWDDIDLEKMELRVNKQVVKRNFNMENRNVLKVKDKKEQKSSWYFSDPKTLTSERTVKFGQALAAALKEEKNRQLKNELFYGEFYTIQVIKYEKDEKGNTIQRIIPVQKCVDSALPRVRLICIAENGEYTSTDSFKYCARVIHHELGIAFDYHSLRHTHATILIEQGANIKNVQARLGHSNITTTLQTYVHDTDQLAKESVDIFENYTTAHQK